MDSFDESEESQAWEVTERVIFRINQNLNRFKKILATTHEQQILLRLLEEERRLYIKKRKIVDVVKVPPSIQAVLREFNSLQIQKWALEKRGFNDIGIVTTSSLGAQIQIIEKYLLTWAMSEFRKRPQLATAIHGKHYSCCWAGRWFMYIILND